MAQVEPPKAILFLDFDGTITRRDAVDAILESYADPNWLGLEAEWRSGRIGSRECLQAQLALVRASRKQIDVLLDEIEIDEGFISLLELCAAANISAHIISDGFDYCIRRILSRAHKTIGSLLKNARICASHLEGSGHLWNTEFPFFHQTCAHGCATCKPAVMRLLNPANLPAIFVGDGLSDQYAVESADLVFAKKGLAAYCNANAVEYIPFNDLGSVARSLDTWLVARVFRENEIPQRASA